MLIETNIDEPLYSDGEWTEEIKDDASEFFINRQNGEFTCYKSGVAKFDNKFGGFEERRCISIAGRPGSGKTTFLDYLMFNLIVNNIDKEILIVCFTFEVHPREHIYKFISRNIGLEREKLLRIGDSTMPLDSQTIHKVNQKIIEYSKFPIIFHSKRITAENIKKACLWYKNKFPHKHLFVMLDHAGLVKPESTSKDMRANMSAVTKVATDIRDETDATTVFLYQASRECEKAENKSMLYQPQLKHLKESGTIEEDSDMVILLHRPDYYNDLPIYSGDKQVLDWYDTGENAIGQCRAIVAKNRWGLSNFYLSFQHQLEFSNFIPL